MAGHIFYLKRFSVISWFFFFKDQVLKKNIARIRNKNQQLNKRNPKERERETYSETPSRISFAEHDLLWKNERIAHCFKLLLKKESLFLHFNFNSINFAKDPPLKSRDVGASQKKNSTLPGWWFLPLGSPCGAWSARSRDSEASRWWCWCSWCFPEGKAKLVADFWRERGPGCFVFFFRGGKELLKMTILFSSWKKKLHHFPAPLQKKLWNENSSFLWNCKRESENCGKLKFHIVLYDFFVVFKFQYPDLRMNDSLLPASQPHGQSPIRGMFGSFRNFRVGRYTSKLFFWKYTSLGVY